MGTYFYNDNGGYHTDDLSLIQTSVKIAPPAQRTKFLEVPYRNGLIDLTEFFGGVTYGNRDITWSFTVTPGADYIAVRDEVEEVLHCQELYIIFDDEPERQYHGRVTVESYERDKVLMLITVKASCDPVPEDAPFKIVRHPKDVVERVGTPITISVVASGSGLSYQWQYSSTGQSWANCTSQTSGYNTPAIKFKLSSGYNNRYYRCIVSKGSDSETSDAAQITVINS